MSPKSKKERKINGSMGEQRRCRERLKQSIREFVSEEGHGDGGPKSELLTEQSGGRKFWAEARVLGRGRAWCIQEVVKPQHTHTQRHTHTHTERWNCNSKRKKTRIWR